MASRHPRSIGADAFIDKAESYVRLSEVLTELFPEAAAHGVAATRDAGPPSRRRH